MENRSVRDLIIANRSCRRFDQQAGIDTDTLKSFVDLARLSASAANLQPLKYILSTDPVKNREIFDCLVWAAYLKDWDGPEPGQQPAGYIVILGDHAITSNFRCDHGIAAQSILLGAVEKGYAGCMIAAINHKKLRTVLSPDESHEILLVIALGRPAEERRLEDLEPGGSIRYWRDKASVHHVPKRGLDEIVIHVW